MSWGVRWKQGPQGSLRLGLLICLIYLTMLCQSIPHEKPETELSKSLADSATSSRNSLFSRSRKKGPGRFSRFSMYNMTRIKRQFDDDDDDWDDDIFGSDDDEEEAPVPVLTTTTSTTTARTTTSIKTTTSAPPTTVKEARESTLPSSHQQRTVRQADEEEDDDEDDRNDSAFFGSGENGSGDQESSDPYPAYPTTTTTKKPDFTIGHGKRFYRITLTIGRSWSPALQVQTSTVFILFEQDLAEQIQRSSEFGNEISSVKIIEVTNIGDPAYVRTKFDIGVEDVPRQEVENEFEKFKDLNAIGSLRVRRDGYDFQDIGAPLDPICLPNELRCRDGSCLPSNYRCDGGKRDCPDHSDEENCPPVTEPVYPTPRPTTTTTTTTPFTPVESEEDPFPDSPEVPDRPEKDLCRADDQVRCLDGEAIICSDQVCDGTPDCPGKEDEDQRMNCSMAEGCPFGQFLCDLTKCLPNDRKCNGAQECDDGQDETDCPYGPSRPVCNPGTEFQCLSDGACLPIGFRCNQRRECSDGSDEESCPLTCRLGEYKCARGGKCLNIAKRCDRVNDCEGGDDEQGCNFPPEPVGCTREQFQCRDGSCIRNDEKCDGLEDCPDGSDEDPQTCRGAQPQPPRDIQTCSASYQFQCQDGGCIERALICDGFSDCLDASDEDPESCPGICETWQLRCGDGSCIDQELICNGRFECSDGLDELNCSNATCKYNEFRCNSGGCIARTRTCDFIPDCRDNSDESPDLCNGLCDEEEVLCDDGRTCLSSDKRCDGVPDCPGGADERDCEPSVTVPPTAPPQTQCRFGEFRCNDGRCIQNLLQCNGYPDCPGGEDERNCATCYGAFSCSNGDCIPASSKCNGREECPNGEDEQGCAPPPCASDQFTCTNGQCIPSAYKCDRTIDCADRSDEEPALCGVTCGPDQFKCLAGGCVPLAAVCNRQFDCADASDEQNCPAGCRSDQFRCVSDGVCIPGDRRCNRNRECADNSDEIGCEPQPSQCLPGQFACRSGDQCVSTTAVCNSIYDCNDFSDEDSSICGGPPEGLHLKTYPADQNIKQGNEVVFQCRDEGQLRAQVRWVRGNGLPLPPGSRDYNGRLEMPSIAVEHTGTYICEAVGYPASTPGARVSVYLRVDPYEPPPTRPPNACALHQATCSSGECISKSMVCDGDIDCEDGSDESRCRGRDGCEPNEFQCNNRRCVPKTWRCDGDDDCGDKSDESSCTAPPPGSPCRYDEFQCSTGGQCIPKAFQCDKEIDCADRSDEIACSPPSIQIPPPSLVTVDVGDLFNISCRVVGIPVPEIVWRLNWGHIPDKCTSTSARGVGVLTCPSIQIADQGAYSCEAINSLGSTFAIPDCTLVVKKTSSPCPEGQFNDLANNARECLPCFCFGHTTQCDSVNLYQSQLPPGQGYRVVGVSQDLVSGVIEVQDRRYTVNEEILEPVSSGGIKALSFSVQRDFPLPSGVYPYFALPTTYAGNQLRSYGGSIRYNLRYRGSPASRVNAPDIVMSGNGITLVYVNRQPLVPGENDITARFWAGEWFKRVYGRPGGPVQGTEPASREEILQVLAKIDYLLLRAQYDQGQYLDTEISNLRMDTASSTNTGQGQALSVEECRCPPGYMGLSCQDCAPGFNRVQQGPWLGICTREAVKVCPEGTYDDVGQCRPCPCPGAGRRFGTSCYRDTDSQITCNCEPGHTGRNCDQCSPGYAPNPSFPYECRPASARCDVAGSLSSTPDPFTQRCTCKGNTIGPLCDECKPNTYHLSTENQYGCINCFCMGVVDQCTSSNMYRNQESTVFYQNPEAFTLVDESQRDIISDGLTVDQGTRELAYRSFNQIPTQIYYWNLPYQYLGDKVTSYGGYLNYTVRYIPPPGGATSPNSAADVELNGNDIRLLYFRKVTIPQNRKETVSVPLLEQYWQRQDGQTANREHLLMALANLDALMIKATYTTTTREAYLSDVTLDYAEARNTGQNRAYEVEQCTCPPGYIGLSCQECAFGYTRSLKGLYLGLCEPCSCNGHTEECDSKTGVCRNCRGFTTGDFCELCEDGYTGNPRTGDCVRSDSRCQCDPRGSARPDCPDGRNCICKGNTQGPSCNQCRPGTFALQEINPQGCLQCFCSGVASDCAAATLYRLPIGMQLHSEPHGFTLTDSYRTMSIQEITVDTGAGELSYNFPASGRSERLYWSLPAKFTGNRVGSYGGNLRATRRYYVRPGSVTNPTEDIDVILVGKNAVSLFYTGSILAGQVVELEVPLRETAGWRHTDSGAKMASREDLMRVLSDVEAILVRATFTDDMRSTHIKDVSVDESVRQYTPNGVIVDVEECRCPVGYDGLSCESCSANYYRDPSDRSRNPLGSCRKCPCGENAEGCQYQYGRPTCICRPGYTGPDCGTRAGTGPVTLPSPYPTYPSQGQEIQVSISESTIVARPGSPVSFRCDARSLSGSQLRTSWSKEGGVIPVGRARDDGRGLLAIADVRREDEGTYVCQATDGYNRNAERARLIVGTGGSAGEGGQPQPQPPTPVQESRPEVTITPRYLNVNVGNTVEFQCTATGYPTPVITWSGGREGVLPAHVQVQGGLLRIPAARKSDEAEYHCKAENSQGMNSLRTIVYVQGEEESRPEPPFGFVVSITPPETEARPGENVRFRCDSSDRQAQIQWAKLSGVLPASAVQSPDGLLTIYSVSEADSGVYACTATAASGQSTQGQGRLSVSFVGSPPQARIEPERQTVPQGSEVEIRCIATGTPTPAIQWSKVGGNISPSLLTTSEVLRIPNVQVSDRGVYVCNVESPAGRGLSSAIVEVERREAPLIEIYPNAVQTVLKDSSALFQCRVAAGIPAPRVTWTRSGGQLPSNVEEIQGGVIRFNRVTGTEKGSYICTAENLAGTTSATALLEIQVPPTVSITPQSPHRVRTGERVRLECRADGDPLPSVTWTKLRPGQLEGVTLALTPDIFGTPQNAIYEISRVSKSDEGSYSCTAQNDAGVEEGRLQLLVEDTSSPVVYPQPQPQPQPSPLPSREREEVYYFPAGSRAELRCSQTFQNRLLDQLYLNWERTDGGPMPSNYDARDGILYINDVRPDDAGYYSCTGTNRDGQTVFAYDVQLQVSGSSPPKIELRPARQVVRRGDTVHIHCAATGTQPIAITWLKLDRRAFPPSVYVNGPDLTFQSIEVSDAGRYACTANNAGGTAEAVAEVIVNAAGPLEPARPARRTQTGIAGQTVELVCNVRGFGVVWSKDGGGLPRTAIPLGPTLTLMSLSPNDAGRYTCESTDGSDEIDLVVEAAEDVSVRVTANKDLLRVGEDVEVRCDVTGDPDPYIRWSKVSGAMGRNVQTYGNVLRVNNVVPENGGVYRCIATTRNGISDADYALTIQANPDDVQHAQRIETRNVPLGTTVTMGCNSGLDLPIEYTWSRERGLIPQAAVIEGPMLTIPDLIPEDSGNYICTATNPSGSVDIPTILTVTGVVPYFTQAPSSYMTLPTLPDSYLTNDIQISFKPEDKNGLILYNGQKIDGTGDFISLGIVNGIPEFRFDIGSGPAVIRADRPIEIGKWHTIRLNRDRKGGSMTVDDLGPFLGNVRGKFEGLDLIENMYIGGVPNFQQIHRLAGHSKGFVGCVSELIISGKKQQLLRDSQTSRGISTCDTCVVNSCRNGGICQEGLTSRGYKCICPPGYSGEDCQIAGQACYPSACGVGKCVNGIGGFDCYCPFGKTGVRCERDIVISEPSFNGDSYLSYPTPKALKKLKMSMKIKPETAEDGLLMYSSQSNNGNGDFTALSIKDGHLEFQYDTGSGPALIRGKRQVNPGEWLEVSVERDAQNGKLGIVGEQPEEGRSPGTTRGLNLNTPLYLGGYDHQSIQLNPSVRVNKGFKGCVSELDVVGMEINLIDSVLQGANVEDCGSVSPCARNPCANDALCTSNSTGEYFCDCPTGYSGRDCEIRDSCMSQPCQNGGTCLNLDTTFKCSCTKGFHGRVCEEVLEFTESVAFRGEGYVELSTDLLPHDNPDEEEIIQLEISTTSNYGLIFWHGQNPTDLLPSDYISVGLDEGRVEFTWDLGDGEGRVLSDEIVNDDKKHLVVLRRQGTVGSIEIDGGPVKSGRSRGLTQMLNTQGNIFLGGAPNPRGMTQGKYSDSFVGCIHTLRIQGPDPIDLNDQAVTAVNIGPCKKDSYKGKRSHQ